MATDEKELEIMFKIQNYMKQNWIDLRASVHACIQKIALYNEKNKREISMSLPKKFIDMLIKVFKNEITRQIKEMKKPRRNFTRLSDLSTMVLYKQSKYIQTFNQILFNQILR